MIIIDRKRGGERNRKQKRKWGEVKMKIKSRKNFIRKKEAERKIIKKWRIKWTEMKMKIKRRMEVMRKRET